jgi:hypothetical protein
MKVECESCFVYRTLALARGVCSLGVVVSSNRVALVKWARLDRRRSRVARFVVLHAVFTRSRDIADW